MTIDGSSFWLASFQEHGSAVMAFLTSRVGRRDLAEDLLQETFVRAIRAGRTPDGPAQTRSYLFTTAHRLLIDRSRRKRPLLFSEMKDADEGRLLERAAAQDPLPDAAADYRRLRERIDAVLDTMSAAHRSAFQLAILEQMPYAEVAAQEGWTIEQVKTNVFRARKKVIAALSDLLGSGAEERV
jgi:RNA polymerase sigma-70 factor (ECF subfamily)